MPAAKRPKLTDKRLYWRGGKIWCRVPGPSGRILRKTTKCTDEAAASAFADERERRYADPAHAAAQAATLEGSVKALIVDMKGRRRAPDTIKIALEKLGHFVRLWGATISMAEVATRGPELVTEYIEKRRGEGVVDFTIKKELQHLDMALAIAVYLKSYPKDGPRGAVLVPPFFTGGHTPRTRTPTLDEFRLVLGELEDGRAAHLVYVVATGSRRKEARLAHRVDVDFDMRLVSMRGTKSKKAASQIPITRITEPMLRWSLKHAPGRDLLFAPWGNLSRDLNAACKRAGVPKFTPNDLRRSFASWHRAELARTPGDKTAAELVSKLLRHTTDKLSQTTYANLPAAEIGQAIEARLLPPAPAEPGEFVGDVGGECAPGDPLTGCVDSVPAYCANRANDAAPARENAEKSRATLGNRTPDLRFTKPSVGSRSERIKAGMRAAEAAAVVPEVYAETLRRLAEEAYQGTEPPFWTSLRRALAAANGDLEGRVLATEAAS